MDRPPRVSILMASYNHARFIAQAIDSVLGQDYADWELIIADDASSDDTLEVLAQYHDPRIRVFPFSVNRQHHMRNFARQQARGEYLAILNSDDLMLSGRLTAQVGYLDNNPQVAAVFTRVDFMDADGAPVSGHWMGDVFSAPNRSRHAWLEHFFRRGNCLCLPSVMMRRTAFDEVGGFDPTLVQLSDFDLWIRLALRWELWILPQTLTAMRVLSGTGNLSSPSLANTNRSVLEHVRIYRHFLSALSLDQATDFLPELLPLLPESTRDWKYFLICHFAAAIPGFPMRLFVFQSLQQLVADDASREYLLEKHPRLMRHFFLAEGAGALRPNPKPVHWVFHPPEVADMDHTAGGHHFWREFAKQTLCFSLPKPAVEGAIRVTVGDGPFALLLRGIRVYDQQSGELLWEMTARQLGNQLAINRGSTLTPRAVGGVLRAEGGAPQFALPYRPPAGMQGKWLDIEFDVSHANPGGAQGKPGP